MYAREPRIKKTEILLGDYETNPKEVLRSSFVGEALVGFTPER